MSRPCALNGFPWICYDECRTSGSLLSAVSGLFPAKEATTAANFGGVIIYRVVLARRLHERLQCLRSISMVREIDVGPEFIDRLRRATKFHRGLSGMTSPIFLRWLYESIDRNHV
jgi:hypothetical protein